MAIDRLAAAPDAVSYDLREVLASAARLARRLGSEPGAQVCLIGRDAVQAEYATPDVEGCIRVARIRPGLALMVACYARAPAMTVHCRGDGLLMLQLRLEGEVETDHGPALLAPRAAVTWFHAGTEISWRVPREGPWRTVSILGTPAALDARWGLGKPLLDALGVEPGRPARAREATRRPWRASAEALAVLRSLLECDWHGPVARAYREARAAQLVCEFLAAGPVAAAGRLTSTRTRERVLRARELLVADPARAHSLASLARNVGVSRTVLAEGFRREFGETVFDCLQRERLHRAWVLLGSSRSKVAAIAAEVGYRDAASFTRAFKARFGMTPTQAARDGAPPPAGR